MDRVSVLAKYLFHYTTRKVNTNSPVSTGHSFELLIFVFLQLEDTPLSQYHTP